MKLVSISDVLSTPENNSSEWFCLPPDQNSWTLETEGVFSLSSADFPPDSDDYLPKQVKENGWIEVLDGGTIEEVVANTKAQLDNPSLNDLLKAFIFYFENDAFMEF
ncbi:DUF7716 domain-containing protein [Photorhabdus thracensis]|uniref:DUF7716 domain-containing protein n=1 Tax=Photorhabdus thracensis TaxID=230089 RepID=UPI001E286F54|nr:hypothetical protein [Photorhabdus thracensis]MCC8423197.1 hypothetical protein [Photorhabdus thracensis]